MGVYRINQTRAGRGFRTRVKKTGRKTPFIRDAFALYYYLNDKFVR